MDGKNEIKSVNLSIYAHDGRRMEIPLEEWQVGVITQILGLSADLSLSGQYELSGRKIVEDRMAIYNNAIRQLDRGCATCPYRGQGSCYGSCTRLVEEIKKWKQNGK